MLIVGLGNVGDEYQGTRHNIGFEVIDRLISKTNIKTKKSKVYLSIIGEGVIGKKKVILTKPQTYMNRSGVAVKLMLKGFGLGLDELLIIYDDLNLSLGQIRIRKSGSGGGHKGVDSIIESLGSQDFGRLRIGIGRPEKGMDISEYVLSPFKEDDIKAINRSIEIAAVAVEEILISGIDMAMNRFNPWKQSADNRLYQTGA